MKGTQRIHIVVAVVAGLFALFLAVTNAGHRLAVAAFSPVAGMMADGASALMRLLPGSAQRSEEAEITRLRESAAASAADAAEAAALRKQNAKLRAMLKMEPPVGWSAVAAEVIGRDPVLWNERMTINRGYDDGVATGAAVLVDECVFGRVQHSDRHSAEVVALTSPQCSFGVQLAGETGSVKRIAGVLRGAGDQLIGGRRGFHVEYLPPVLQVQPNQLIVTSGLGGWLPEGLPVGRVVADEPSGGCLHIVDTVRGELHCVPCVEDTTPYFVIVLRQNIESGQQ